MGFRKSVATWLIPPIRNELQWWYSYCVYSVSPSCFLEESSKKKNFQVKKNVIFLSSETVCVKWKEPCRIPKNCIRFILQSELHRQQSCCSLPTARKKNSYKAKSMRSEKNIVGKKGSSEQTKLPLRKQVKCSSTSDMFCVAFNIGRMWLSVLYDYLFNFNVNYSK